MGLIEPDPVDARGGRKGLDIDRSRAFEAQGVKLFIFKQHVIVFAARITLRRVIFANRRPGDRVDILADDPIAGVSIKDVEANFFAFSRGRRHRDRTGHKRKLQIAFPE